MLFSVLEIESRTSYMQVTLLLRCMPDLSLQFCIGLYSFNTEVLNSEVPESQRFSNITDVILEKKYV